MDTLYFDDFEDFANEVSNTFESLDNEFNDVSVIAKYEEAKKIIEKLIRIEYSVESIELHRPNWDDYHDEYIISLNSDGVWCDPMKRDNRYISDESTFIYVLDNCNSKVIPYCRGEFVYEVSVGKTEEYDCGGCDYDECFCCTEYGDPEKYVEYSKDKDGNMHGFSASRSDGKSYYSYSVYTSDKLSTKDIQSLLQEAGF